jgi:hypothetical protein
MIQIFFQLCVILKLIVELLLSNLELFHVFAKNNYFLFALLKLLNFLINHIL